MSDNELIRRVDVIKVVSKEMHRYGFEMPGGRADQIQDAIAAIPAVTVKPLEWVEIRPGQYFEARVLGICYSVRLGTDGVFRWQVGYMGTWIEEITQESAKAAAESDYEARIRSMLVVQSSPDVAALVDALGWYAEQSRLCRLIHSEGDAGRNALQADGGEKARAALARVKGGE